jgi:hypothetical protein
VLPLPSLGQTASHAPPNTPNIKRIEGTVARVEANEFLLRVKGGTTETYQLSPSVQIVRSRPGLMSDLSNGKFVGCTSVYDDGAKGLAGECHIFPDGMHGFARDHVTTGAPAASASAINGTISDARDDVGAAQATGRRILIQISNEAGATAMAVSSLTKITIISAADASALKAGVKVSGISDQAADGTGVIQLLTVMSAPAGDSPTADR